MHAGAMRSHMSVFNMFYIYCMGTLSEGIAYCTNPGKMYGQFLTRSDELCEAVGTTAVLGKMSRLKSRQTAASLNKCCKFYGISSTYTQEISP